MVIKTAPPSKALNRLSEMFSSVLIHSKHLKIIGRALVAHTYNPNYSGGSDQNDQGSKPAQGWWSGSRCKS
jgi:hypothetical protein